MKTLIGGAVAAALGLVGLGIWWSEFLMVLAGIIPIMLLLGGGLAIYLGFDELKDNWKKDEPAFESSSVKETRLSNIKRKSTNSKMRSKA